MTNTVWPKIEPFLKSLQKPAQYIGGETNAIVKDWTKAQIRVCLVFPDTYEIGMSHTGLKILYAILNAREGVVAERCFAPQPNMEALLREKKIPLFSLETKTPLADFDIIGITLPHELVYTNVLNILDLAGLPLLSKDRDEQHPLIIGGGPQCYNPEPIADFFDAFGLGDGEELIVDLVNAASSVNGQRSTVNGRQTTDDSRRALLTRLAKIPGLYIPSFFEPTHNTDGTIKKIRPLLDEYPGVQKRIVNDLDQQPYPVTPIVPNIRLVHDRVDVEIQRGCTRGCRFCQAGMVERPVRRRQPDTIVDIANKSLDNSGIEELSLLSLSAGDYPHIAPLLGQLNHLCKERRVSLSVPATRTETLTPEMIAEIKKVRMTGFTIAPEAGSERLRRVINKGNRLDDLLIACRNAFAAGYRLIKFYFMCGLPTETNDDLWGIVQEAETALKVGREFRSDIQINLSLSTFVPKPFTPFQWEKQISIDETREKHTFIKANLKYRAINFKHHDPKMSFLEGIFARGDRRLSRLILTAFKNGCRLDEWTEHFNFTLWEQSLKECNIDAAFYLRSREQHEILPWDHLFTQMKKEWLWEESEKAKGLVFTSDCTLGGTCAGCGVCDEIVKREAYLVRRKEKDTSALASAASRFTNNASHSLDPSRLRVRFSKTGPAAIFSHLELMGILKRAIERNKIPVAYSEGFHPQMKLSMGYALPLGVESEWEFFDLPVTHTIQPSDFINDINNVLPSGIRILDAEYVDLKAPSLYLATKFVNYSVHFSDEMTDGVIEQIQKNIEALKDCKEFLIKRISFKDKKTRFFKLHEHVDPLKVALIKRDLTFELKCGDQGSVKPIEVVSALSGLTKENLIFVRVSKVGVTFA